LALVRDEQKSERLVAKYHRISTLIGDLDSTELLETTSYNADVVINAGPDVTHEAGISAILRGLERKRTKGYYIQTSGAALIWAQPDGSKPGTRIWDDVKDIRTITSMPLDRTHRLTDKLAFDAAAKVNVAVISPVLVYGLSPSTEHPFPLVLGEVVKAVRALGTGFTVSAGKNIISHIHVLDLARLYLLLLSSALKAQHSDSQAEDGVWGSEAYYFAASGEVSFAEYMAELVRLLKEHGIVESEEIRQIDVHQGARASGAEGEEHAADSWAMHIAISFGTDMRCRSSRARGLGWQPKEAGVVETLEESVGKLVGVGN